MTMQTGFSIESVPAEHLSAVWPAIAPHLLAGASVDPGIDVEEEIGAVMQGRSRVWAIIEQDRCVAAFLTAVVNDCDGRALDVFGLGGSGMLRWGKALTERMTAYAKEAGCDRVLFKGRRALLRTYPGVRITGHEDGNIFIFERAV